MLAAQEIDVETAGSPAAAPALSQADLAHFNAKGWVIVRGGEQLTKDVIACTRAQILPELKKAGVDSEDPTTWHRGEKWHCCWDAKKADSNRDGAHVGGLTPIQPPPALFAADGRLSRAVAQLLGGPLGHGRVDPDSKPGWFVVRYPYKRRVRHWTDRCCLMRMLHPCLGWHVDGIGRTHQIHSPDLALVALPVFGTGEIVKGGGMTSFVNGSHRRVSTELARAYPSGKSYLYLFVLAMRLAWCSRFCCCCSAHRLENAEPAQPGDVVLMHPRAAHSSSENIAGSQIRIANRLEVAWHGTVEDHERLWRLLAAEADGKPIDKDAVIIADAAKGGEEEEDPGRRAVSFRQFVDSPVGKVTADAIRAEIARRRLPCWRRGCNCFCVPWELVAIVFLPCAVLVAAVCVLLRLLLL